MSKPNKKPMVGIYDVEVVAGNIKYTFTLKRKISVVVGNSGTGKSTLCAVIRDITSDANIGKIKSRVPLTVLQGDLIASGLYRDVLVNNENRIYIIDENSLVSCDNEFYRIVQQSNSYFLFISREPLYKISYSPEDIYYMDKNRHGNHQLVQKYIIQNTCKAPDKLIIEDSKAGYAFFRALCEDDDAKCISAKGNSNVFQAVKASLEPGKMIMAIVDGAGFGPYINEFTYKNLSYNYCLFLYESFEWLLLKSKLFEKDKEVQAILKEPYNYISALDYSWERYFTKLLAAKTHGTPAAYTKSYLNCCYTEDCCCKKEPCELMVKGNKFDAILTGVFDTIDFSKVRADVRKVVENNSSTTKMSLQ